MADDPQNNIWPFTFERTAGVSTPPLSEPDPNIPQLDLLPYPAGKATPGGPFLPGGGVTGDVQVHSLKVTLTSAQIQLLSDDGFLLVAAPNVIALAVVLHFIPGTTPYDNLAANDLQIGNFMGDSVGLLDQTDESFEIMGPTKSTNVDMVDGLWLYGNTNPADGDGTLEILLQYAILDF